MRSEGHNTRGPSPLEGLPGDIVAVAIGDEHALACNRQGELYAWGLGASGKLGSGDTTNRLLPVHITAAPLHQVGRWDAGSTVVQIDRWDRW